MKPYTKSGDDGETAWVGGARVPKDDPRVIALGDVDELNAAIGLAAVAADERRSEQLREIQADLFVMGAQLATPGSGQTDPVIDEARITRLEAWIDAASADVPPLKEFALPGGSESAARFHLARAVCRRAERTVVHLAREAAVDRLAIVYLNRLSDLLFACARLANQQTGIEDVVWKQDRKRG